MKVPLISVVLVLLSGCAHWFGPAHGVFDAVGSTPGNLPCQLFIAPVGSSGICRVWTVTGDFRQSVLVSHSRKGHIIALSCNNTIIAMRTFKYGRDVDTLRELDI